MAEEAGTAQAVADVAQTLGQSMSFVEDMIKAGWTDGGRAYVINTDTGSHLLPLQRE